MACLSSQQLILHLHLVDTCAVLHPETCGKNMAIRHETNATKVSAGFQGPFQPLFTVAQTARLLQNSSSMMFCSRQKKELSKTTIVSCIYHLSLFDLNCVSQQCKLTSVS